MYKNALGVLLATTPTAIAGAICMAGTWTLELTTLFGLAYMITIFATAAAVCSLPDDE